MPGLNPTGATVVADGVVRLGVDDTELSRGLDTSFTKVEAFATGIGLVVAAGFAVGVKAASDFESAFAGVRKTIDEETLGAGRSFDTLEQKIRDLATTIPVTFEALSGIGELAGQLGVTGEESLTKFIDTIAKLEVTTDLTAEAAATSFARIGNVLGITGDQIGNFTEKLGSVVVELGNNLATTESQIISMVTRMSGAGQIANIAAEDLAAIAAAMSSVGVESEIGGTTFQRVLLDMNQAVIEGGEQLEIYAKIARTTSKDFAKLFEKDAARAFLEFVKGLKKEGKNAATSLGDLGFEQQRLISVLLRASSASDVMSDALRIAGEEAKTVTALTDEAAKRFETFESKMKIAGAQVRELESQIGKALIPTIINLVDAFVPLISATGEFIGQNPAFVRNVGLATAALLAYESVIIGRGLVTGTRALTGAMSALGTTSTVATGAAGAGGILGLNAATGLWVGTIALGVASLVELGIESVKTARALKEQEENFNSDQKAIEAFTKTLDENGIAYDRAALFSKNLGVANRANADAMALLSEKTGAVSSASQGVNVIFSAMTDSAGKATDTLRGFKEESIDAEEKARLFGERLGLTGDQISEAMGEKTKTSLAEAKAQLGDINEQAKILGVSVETLSGSFESGFSIISGAVGRTEEEIKTSMGSIATAEKAVFDLTRKQGFEQFDPWGRELSATTEKINAFSINAVNKMDAVAEAARNAASALDTTSSPMTKEEIDSAQSDLSGLRPAGELGFANGQSGIVGDAGIERIIATPQGTIVESNQKMRQNAKPNITVNAPISIDASNADPASVAKMQGALSQAMSDTLMQSFRAFGLQPEIG